jgi:hypothetical protein
MSELKIRTRESSQSFDELSSLETSRSATFSPSFLRSTPLSPMEAFKKNVNEMLNKIGDRNYEKLSQKIINIEFANSPVTTEGNIHLLANIFVDKALFGLNSEIFSRISADLISAWSTEIDYSDVDQEELSLSMDSNLMINSQNEIVSRGDVFREALIERCVEEFEFERVSRLEEIYRMSDKEISEEEEERFVKRVKNTMQTISSLYNKDIFTSMTIANFIYSLVDTEDGELPEEIELNSAIILARNTGKKLEAFFEAKLAKSKKKSSKYLIFQNIISKMEEFVKNKKITKKMKIKTQALLDLKGADWEE